MSNISIKPQNLPETLVWYYIISTYGIYLLGAQFPLAVLLACFLGFYLLIKWWNQTEETSLEEKIAFPMSIWVWLIAMLVIAIALVIGHLNFDYGVDKIAKTYLKWIPLVLFPLAGLLNIRSQLISRAICILCLQSLILIPILYLASTLHFPGYLYASPLAAFGSEPSRYEVNLYYRESANHIRLYLFANNSPTLGLIGNIYFHLAKQELDKKWRWFGITGAIAIIISTLSRGPILYLPFTLITVWLLTNFARPWIQFVLGFISFIASIFLSTLINFLQTSQEQLNNLRAGSSRVRSDLQKMAIDRWWNEAPIWGHGSVEITGPEVVSGMPIGSHHTWFGILFSQGLVGCLALAMALGWSFIDLLIKAQTSEQAKVGLSVILVFIFFSFQSNIEFDAYLCWPGLVMIGIAFKESLFLPYKTKQCF